ncbi:extracellular catalytic domain type 1 short-chain-length polyhydroxyalkanoate depolymerase [Faunimonas sp. B44]|uniref:extracellular catalytic domain type 1 short-chain-length polyhydroxyalkanoate depolymerase n=1 Tax=Faunimonas sp. B44 TaxID=3461493 RepID=UPI0040442505
MSERFGAAMRKAARLTGARKLLEATEVIQQALGGRGEPRTGTPQPGAPAGGPAANGDGGTALDLTAEIVRVRRAPAETEPATKGQRTKTAPSGRPVRPLGEVVEGLRHGRFARSPGAPATPEGAVFLEGRHSAAGGSRTYKLYRPATAADEGDRPLIVMLHGCTQNPDDFAAGTGMNRLAEEHGFLVLYPAQSRQANQSGCWNWFDGGHQRRGRGEPALIAAMTRAAIAEHGADPGRVFVAGLSAGGAMAAVMGATYPDLYHAVGIHSGLAYGAASDVASAFRAMRGEHGEFLVPGLRPAPKPRPGGLVRTIVIHGDADATVHHSNGERIASIVGTRLSEAEAEAEAVRESGEANGRSYERVVIRDGAGIPVLEHWIIHGAGHAWFGGDPAGSYADPAGPDASREMVRFFLEGARP